MTAAVLTPFTAAEAVELGNRLWRKKVLPVGDVEYKGRLLHFTRDYLGRLVQAFTDRAYNQVPFQLADSQNTHTNDPERTRGWVKGMELGDDGLYVTAEVTEAGEKVLKDNPQLGISARIVEDYARSDGRRFPAAVQHVLGTLDPRIPGLGAWEAIEAASPAPDQVIDLSGESFVDLDWSEFDRERAGEKAHDTASATAKATAARHKADKPLTPIDWAKSGPNSFTSRNNVHSLIREGPRKWVVYERGRKVHTAPSKDAAMGYDPAKQTNLAGDAGADPEGGADMADLGNLTDAQRARLAMLLDLDDDTLDTLADGGVVVTPEELDALTAPDDDDEDDGGDGLADAVDAMTDDEIAALEAEFDAEFDTGPEDTGADLIPEGEPVTAGLSAEAQFAIDLANARAEETARELSVVTARLREEDYLAERRRLADLGVPPYVTDLAKPLLEGAGHAVELANGKTVDAGAIMRRVLTEYASQARLLDLDVELGSPHDEPEDAGRQQQAESRDDLVGRFRSMTGL